MKQFVCEMCGSSDLLKQDGLFVCQSCGTKYTTEDAKKLLVEGSAAYKLAQSCQQLFRIPKLRTS